VDACKEFLLNRCSVDENDASLTEIKVGFMQIILACHGLY